MGAWGAGSFENDTALDWVWELESDSDGSVLRRAFASFPAEDEGCMAIAAAEVVAAALGKPLPELPDEVGEWLAKNRAVVNPKLRSEAEATVRIVRNESELRELWEDAGADEWLAVVDDLLGRLAVENPA